MTTLSTRDTEAIADALTYGDRFTTYGALHGTPSSWPQYGYLPNEWRDALRDGGTGCAYVVYSYGTPVAWQSLSGAWYVPAVRYSATTSRHQGTVRRALASIGVDYIETLPVA